MTTNFDQKSANAANRELQNDKKVSNQAKELNAQLSNFENDIYSIKTELNEKTQSSYDKKRLQTSLGNYC